MRFWNRRLVEALYAASQMVVRADLVVCGMRALRGGRRRSSGKARVRMPVLANLPTISVE